MYMINEFRIDSDLYKEILAKFDGRDKHFPTDECQAFLSETLRLVNTFRENVFIKPEGSSFGFVGELQLRLTNLYQEYFGLKVLIDAISDVGNESYLIFKYPHPNDSLADVHLSEIYRKIEREKVSVLEKIRNEEQQNRFNQIHDFSELKRKLDEIEQTQSKIELVEDFLVDLEDDQEALILLKPVRRQVKELLGDLRLELEKEKEIFIKSSLIEEMEKQFQEQNKIDLETDSFELSNPAKLVLLHQLGVLDHLIRLPGMGSINNVAYFISKLIGMKQSSVQPYLNPLLSPSTNSLDKSPYSDSAIIQVKKILEKKGFTFKEVE